MKKFFAILTLVLAVAIVSQAQTPEVKRVGADVSSVSYGVLANTLDDSTETVYKIFDLSQKNKLQYYTITLNFDQQSDDESDFASTIVVNLQKSYDYINYSNIDTVTYGVSADTAFSFQDVTTGTDAPWLRLKLYANSDSASAILTRVHGRFIDK